MAGESKPRRRFLRWVVLAMLPLLLALAAIQADVLLRYAGHCHSLQTAPDAPVAIVLGAKVRPDRTPSHMLDDRLLAAAALWQDGKVQRILVSGDHAPQRGYDEVQVMAEVLVGYGVPRDRIDIDPAGYRTLDSMWRARHVFGLRRALVVTNGFHLPRAVWLGRQFGIEVDGVAAPPAYEYSLGTRVSHDGREFGARVLAWLDVRVLGTEPRDPAPTGDDQISLIAGADELSAALEQRRGTAMLVNFWAMWCQPCVEELPALDQAHRLLREQGGEMLGVAMDLSAPGEELDAVRRRLPDFLREHGVDYPILLLTDGDILPIVQRFDLPGPLPTTIAIDHSGEVVAIHKGGASIEQLRKLIDRALVD